MQAVDGVSFDLSAGEILAVVGESGSGKSVTAMTLMGLTRSPNASFGGTAHYKGTELIDADEDQLRAVRGAEIAMIFQDPMTSLNPVQKIGKQIMEQIQEHEALPDSQARDRTIELLDQRRNPARPRAGRQLPVRVLGRHAPARDDRDGALLQSRDSDRGRADHGARRNDPGADPPGHPRAARGDRRGGDPGHARPRRGGRPGRPNRRDVLRPDRRAGHARRDLLRPPAPVHLGPARLDHPSGPAAARTPPGHRRSPAITGAPAGGMPLPAALPARVRGVHQGAAARGRSSRAAPTTRIAAGSPSRTSARAARSEPGEIGLAQKEGTAA